MKTDRSKKKAGFFGKILDKMSGDRRADSEEPVQRGGDDTLQMHEDFDAVKSEPGQITGADFDRAFEFIEQYPDSPEAEILIGQMYSTTPQTLKGLTYSSALKILETMPAHTGRESIIKGMRKIEKDYIKELKSDVIAYMLQIIPDHPLADELTTALSVKNLTKAYDFVIANPENPNTKAIIKAMFDRDANVTLLLLQEKMDHPQVPSIFAGVYGIGRIQVSTLTPNAILYVLDVAPDHPEIKIMIEVLVESNYPKAFHYVKVHPDHSLAGVIKKTIQKRKPELQPLLDEL